MNKEAIEKLLKEAKHQGCSGHCVDKINQALAILKEQPNCEGCEFFKHTNKFDHCWRYTEARSLCKLRQPVEQPPAGDLAKEAIELDKMCVSEIVAKYESSHNAITVLKRKFREACESDEWMKSATEFYENGGCPICFSTDEAGCTEGCYLGQLQDKLKEQPSAGDALDGHICIVIGDLSKKLRASEASREELLTACRQAFNKSHNPEVEKILQAAIKQGECGEKERKL